jgi:hypothetical protein
MQSETVAWALLMLGLVAAIGSFIASERGWSRIHFVLTLTALVLVAAASVVLASS